MEKVFAVQVSILKSVAFSRDCYVAAGVSLCAALQVCLKEEELRLFIAQGIFCWSSVVRFTDIVSKIPFAGDICSEISSFSSEGFSLQFLQVFWFPLVLRIVWNNLEDPFSQTVKQVHLMFDLLLDIQTTVTQTDDDKVGIRESLLKIVRYLLRLGSRCKGRYVPLASLTELGAKTLLDMSLNLLFEMANAYTDDDVFCAVTSSSTVFFRKIFSPVRTSLEKQYKLGSWQPLVASGNSETCLSK